MPGLFELRFSLALMFISVLQLPACDLTGGPEKVKERTEAQLRQYFPNGHAIVSPAKATIVGVTCARGLGQPLVAEIAEELASKRAIRQLHDARLLPLKLSPYHLFVLEFDKYSIRLDTDADRHWIVLSGPQSRLDYEMLCTDR